MADKGHSGVGQNTSSIVRDHLHVHVHTHIGSNIHVDMYMYM